jgi:cell volume regulation protein A
VNEVEVALGAGAAVLLVAVLAVRVSTRLGLPSLLLYLAIGLLIGEAGLGIQYSNTPLTAAVGIGALVLILAEGGLTTRWSVIRPALAPGIALATVAVAVRIGITGWVLHLALGVDWRTALLWGAVLSSTDAAAVFSVLRALRVSPRLAGALELESGINDAPVYIAVVLLASGDLVHWWTPLLVVYELLAGALVGAALGSAGAWALRRAALPATGLYPLATIAVCVLAFAAGQGLHASGFLATYLAGLVLGNARLPHRGDTLSFAEGLGWLAQITLFVLLGLYASPARLPGVLIPALVAGAVLVVLARPVSVALALTPLRVPWREQSFLSWSGLRGAVPIVLALIALTQGFPGAQRLVDVVFVLVVVLTAVQGVTLPVVARWLGLARPEQGREMEVDSAALDEMGAELLQIKVPQPSRLHGVYLWELRLPTGAVVSLVVRDGQGFTPEPSTRLQAGDQLLVVTTADRRQ